MKYFFLALLSWCIGFTANAQAKTQYKLAIIGFYNLENFYDTIDNPIVDDQEFLPKGDRNYNTTIYYDKIGRLAKVISEMGADKSPDGPAILGVAEIENDTVLADLVKHPLLAKRNYKIVHYDSPDARGVDVGFLYNPKYFTVLDSKPLFVKLPGGSKDAYYTRDILWVKGTFDGDVVHVYVNHWPSRRGGEERSAPARAAAAQVAKNHIDSIAKVDGTQKVILMGDLNDDPVSPSITEVLRAKGKADQVREGGFYNPWTDFYKKGLGTLAYQDAWGLFDQILITSPWLERNQSGYFFYQQYIFNPEYMVENSGRYKGYPMRTWDGMSYRSGYSDHFPTYLVMLKKM
ncbi:MAG TPA: endonuclease/exonuclease/phosphatase [Chitinophagaceae bacterium]|nr:endonuclease/exonuclease/phosphatase [Chitinophagaceae bacterium]